MMEHQNNNEWIMLIEDNGDLAMVDVRNNTSSDNTSNDITSSENSYTSDDALALKILGNNFACEGQNVSLDEKTKNVHQDKQGYLHVFRSYGCHSSYYKYLMILLALNSVALVAYAYYHKII